MRKSRQIRLVLLSSLSLVALAACEENDPLKHSEYIRDAKECAAKPDPDSCRTALADARAQHVQTAPRFATREECEAQFGKSNCGTSEEVLRFGDEATQTAAAPSAATSAQPQAQSSGSSFMPLMMGYMLGRMLGGAGSGPWAAQPLYRDPNNMAYSAGKPLGQLSANRFPNPPQALPGSTVQRGGFGRTGTATTSSAAS